MFGWTAVAFIAAVIILCGTIHIFASSGDSRPSITNISYQRQG